MDGTPTLPKTMYQPPIPHPGGPLHVHVYLQCTTIPPTAITIVNLEIASTPKENNLHVLYILQQALIRVTSC